MRWVDWYSDGSLHVLDVALACCSLEFDAAARGAALVAEPSPDARTAVVVSGTVTDRLAPAVAAVVDGLRARQEVAPVVVAYGVCACTGGPYWDSYAVTKGVDTLVPVDVYVPGCPPTPAALREVLDTVADRGGVA
ncbi:NADH-quinone oxidoreductase subunit B [Microlunatus flavus]|uniref:NADH-quinone oxidoreductase subunit B n=1 Tax=Microlunatus flavus TaxID=1036181 RepID=A0A1H9LW58_9ACTN|nr:proton-conducting membrane transporter [Microlunatus flavus]SER15083.1 NADH-quinone oxidoreductase subunit B [Microlunatus flavus]